MPSWCSGCGLNSAGWSPTPSRSWPGPGVIEKGGGDPPGFASGAVSWQDAAPDGRVQPEHGPAVSDDGLAVRASHGVVISLGIDIIGGADPPFLQPATRLVTLPDDERQDLALDPLLILPGRLVIPEDSVDLVIDLALKDAQLAAHLAGFESRALDVPLVPVEQGHRREEGNPPGIRRPLSLVGLPDLVVPGLIEQVRV